MIRTIEHLYAREFDNQSERKKKAKDAILKEQETIQDVMREAARDKARAGDTSLLGGGVGGRSTQVYFDSLYPETRGVAFSSMGAGGGASGMRQVVLHNIGTYTGDTIKGVPQGKGRLDYLNRDVYEGRDG